MSPCRLAVTLIIPAFCSQNGYSYPVGPTSGIPGSQTTFAWDIASYQAAAGATPLIQASYTFRAFDQRYVCSRADNHVLDGEAMTPCELGWRSALS